MKLFLKIFFGCLKISSTIAEFILDLFGTSAGLYIRTCFIFYQKHFLDTLNENGNFIHKQTKNNSFWEALFRTLTVAPSVGLFSKL
jgi:hypothetical protein